MRRAAKPILAATALGLATLLSGCVTIVSQSAQQLNTIGAVRLTTTVCFSQQSGCPDRGNSDTQATSGGFQVVVGYRIPEATTVPQAFSSAAGQQLVFNRDSSYGAELERLIPTDANQKWAGYRSAGFAAAPTSPTFTVAPTFTLKQGPDGEPFEGPFYYRTVTGARATPGNPNAPVDCGADPRGNNSNKTTCVDSPAISDLGTNLLQPTQDLGILDDPALQRASGGDTEAVQFRAMFAGRTPAPSFDLRAATDVPGGEAKPRPTTFSPSANGSKVRVNVEIPSGTPHGSYDVTLVATLANGQTRSRTQELRVGPSRPFCGMVRPTIVGTPGPDDLVGTPKRDVIAGYGANDRIDGLAGNDLICAGNGNDVARGGAGNDTIAGRAGKDMLCGGPGRDTLVGGPGKDRFRH
jgi:RTX calcium-binding nonapeptide repeat (4 copies)